MGVVGWDRQNICVIWLQSAEVGYKTVDKVIHHLLVGTATMLCRSWLFLSLLLISSECSDACKSLCGWLGVYLDAAVFFFSPHWALLLGSSVCSSRLGPDMSRHENVSHAHTNSLSLGKNIFPMLICHRCWWWILKHFQLSPELLFHHLPDFCSLSEKAHTHHAGNFWPSHTP